MMSITKLIRLVFLETLILVFSIFSFPLCIPPANAASVTLAWDPNSEPEVVGYRVYYGKALGNYESLIDVGNQTTCSISDLEDGEVYYFVVTAYNLLGRESDFSSELKYPEPFSLTTSLSTGQNLISIPLEPLNPSISAVTETLSPCLLQVLMYTKDAEGTDTWLYYDPSFPDQSTLAALEPGKGYWVEMACPGEMAVVGNRTTNPVALTPGLNLVGYNSLTSLPVPDGLKSITDKYAFVWGYEDDQWTFYDPADEVWNTLQILTPGSGYWIEAPEETAWTLPSVMTIPLSSGLNLISLPLEPLNPSISAVTERLSPCLLQVLAYTKDVEGYDTWLYYDPTQLDQSTLRTMEPGKGYWVEMMCPGEMTIVGKQTTNPVALTPGLNLVGYNSLKPLPISVALSSIADKCTMVWAYEDDEWRYYDPADVAGSTLQILTPGSGYWIEVTEETTWVLP